MPLPQATPTQPPSHTATQAPAPPVTTAVVRFTITWPAPKTASIRRRPAYLSNSTASIAIVVNGISTVVNDPNLAPGAGSGGTQSTTIVDVDAPVGNDTFLVTDYDAAGATGNVLAQSSIPFTVLAAQLNLVNVTLNGNLAKIACVPIGPIVTYTSGTSGSLTMVGPAGQIMLLPEDADSNIIIAPGAIPALTLAPATASQATITATSTANEYTANLLVSNTAVTLDGSGTNLAGSAVSSTCSVTRVPALYVTNYGIEAQNPSVTIYPVSASGNATPTATLKGPNTLESAVQFDAVDPKGNLFVTNQGPMPGATYGPATGYVSIYAPGTGQNGNQAPIGTITGLNRPEGIAFDSSGNLYVVSLDRIQVFPPGADGVTAPASPSKVIVGSNTDLVTCYGMFVANGLIYTSCTPYPFYLATFPVTASGNATPTLIDSPGSTADSYNEISWLSVAADSSGNIYAPDANNNLNSVLIYPSAESTVPVIATGSFSQPVGIFIDSGNAIYIANYGITDATGTAGSPSVEIFSGEATLEAGLATSTISGTMTGLNGPYGVTVR